MIIAIIILLISAIAFLFIGYKFKSWQITGYSFLCIILIVLILFLKANPDIKVSSQYITLEKRVQTNEQTLEMVKSNQQNIEATQAQLQKTATALLKTILVVEDGVGRFGGADKQRTDKLIQKYTKEIQSILPKEYSKEIHKDLDSLSKTP